MMLGDWVLRCLGFRIPPNDAARIRCRVPSRKSDLAAPTFFQSTVPTVADLEAQFATSLPRSTVVTNNGPGRKQEIRRRMTEATIKTIRAMNVFFENQGGFSSEQAIRNEHTRQLDAALSEFAGDAGDLVGLAGAFKALVAIATVDGALSGVTPGFAGLQTQSYVVRPGFLSAAYISNSDDTLEMMVPVSGAFELQARFTQDSRATITETLAVYQSSPMVFPDGTASPLCFSLDSDGAPSKGTIDLRTGEIEHTESLLIWAPGLHGPVPWSVRYAGILLKTRINQRNRGLSSAALGYSIVVIPQEVPLLGGLSALILTWGGDEEPAPKPPPKPAPKPPPKPAPKPKPKPVPTPKPPTSEEIMLARLRIANAIMGLAVPDAELLEIAKKFPNPKTPTQVESAATRLLSEAEYQKNHPTQYEAAWLALQQFLSNGNEGIIDKFSPK